MPPTFGQPEAVPASTGPTLVLLNMWAVETEPRLGGPLMKALAAAAPLTGLQHLKRVRKQGASLHVLLCRVDWRRQGGEDGQQQDDGQAANGQQRQQPSSAAAAGEANGNGSSSSLGQAPDLPPAVADIVQQHSMQPFIAQVPLHAPITREQFTEWGKHWPMTWRCPDASALPHLIELSQAEVAAMQRHMAAAWQLAAASGAEGGIANACVIVDPQRDAVIAQAADCSHSHPLQHAAMAAVAAAAQWQLRVWPPQQGEEGSSSGAAAEAAAAAVDAAAPAHAGLVHAASGQLDAADGKRRRLEGSADVRGAAVMASATANGQSSDAAGGGSQTAAAAADSRAAAEPASAGAAADAADGAPAAAAAADGDPGPRPYLCTGYDAYLLHEPCVMCAMALVHSRLRRVVYCVPDARHGALGGALKLHSQRSLNHHYAVWRLPLAGGGE